MVLARVLVDTRREYTWVPAKSLEKIGIEGEKKDVFFVLAKGQHVTRNVGFAIIRLDKHFTIDEIVFAESGDLPLLGARLEGLTLTVDSRLKKLWPPDHCLPRNLAWSYRFTRAMTGS